VHEREVAAPERERRVVEVEESVPERPEYRAEEIVLSARARIGQGRVEDLRAGSHSRGGREHRDPGPARADGDREGREEREGEHENHASERKPTHLQPEPGSRDEGAGEREEEARPSQPLLPAGSCRGRR
jgi:hypothetical protein